MKYCKIMAFIIISAIIVGILPGSFTEAASKSVTIRMVVDGNVSTCKATKKNGDWTVKVKDVKKALGISKPAGRKSGTVALDAVAKKADIYYECDTVLNAAYFWTDIPYGDIDYARAFELGLVPEEYRSKRGKVITSKEFRKLLTDLIKIIDKKKLSVFDNNVSTYDKKLLGGEAVGMAYYAAKAIGADDIEFWGIDSAGLIEKGEGDAFWSDTEFEFKKLFPNFYKGKVTLPGENIKCDNDRNASYMWLFYHQSDYSGELMIPFDYDKYTFHLKEAFTWDRAIAILTRLYDSSNILNVSNVVKVSDSKAENPDTRVLSETLLKKAKKLAGDDTSKPHPTGFILMNEMDLSVFPTSDEELKTISQWGFNSVKLMLRYEYFFNEDVTKVDLNKLKDLDEIIAAAIRYRLHMNIAFESLPGRALFYIDELSRTGSFDMYINDKHLKQAETVWEVISARYKDVPNKFISFTPLWEAQNRDLSSGMGGIEFTWEDAKKATLALTESIRKKDPDRFIMIEPSPTTSIDALIENDHTYDIFAAVSEKYDNVIITSNFCEKPYVYQEMNSEEGKDIDLYSHGMYKQEYPTYIYAASAVLGDEYPTMEISGFLPEGTVVDIYLRHTRADSSLKISADEKILYSEDFDQRDYEQTTSFLSQHYPYAETEKKISVKLSSAVNVLSLKARSFIVLGGINITLPEEYAVEKLYYPSRADYAEGLAEYDSPYYRMTSNVLICPNTFDGTAGFNITVKKDITYTSDGIFEKSDSGTVARYFKDYNSYFPEAVFRFEEAHFDIGTTEDSMIRYYSDILKNCKKYNYGWYSCDLSKMFSLMYEDSETGTLHYSRYDVRGSEAMGLTYTEYKGKYLQIPLLKCLQKYQCSER